MNLLCKRTLKMPFIGDFSLGNVRAHFQRQTKKERSDVSLSNGSLLTYVRVVHPQFVCLKPPDFRKLIPLEHLLENSVDR